MAIIHPDRVIINNIERPIIDYYTLKIFIEEWRKTLEIKWNIYYMDKRKYKDFVMKNAQDFDILYIDCGLWFDLETVCKKTIKLIEKLMNKNIYKTIYIGANKIIHFNSLKKINYLIEWLQNISNVSSTTFIIEKNNKKIHI